MIIINYNNTYRETLKNTIDTLKFDIHHLRSMSEEEAVTKYRDTLYDIEESKKNKDFRENSILCMFMDTYKLTIYKLKNGLLTKEDLIFLETLLSIESSNEILAQVSCDIEFFDKIILGGYHYASYDNLTKHLIDKSLSKEEIKKITKLVPCLMLDAEKFTQKVTLAKLIDNIEIQVAQNEELVDDPLLSVVLIKVNGFINNIYKVNKSETIALLIDMIKLDYACCKYMNIFDERINFYETSSFECIIEKVMNNQEALNELIEMIFNVYIHKSYNNKELSVDEIKKVDIEQVSKKLVLK